MANPNVAKDAEKYRLDQARKLLSLFEDAHGRPARTTEELGEWLQSPQGEAATKDDRLPDGTINPDG